VAHLVRYSTADGTSADHEVNELADAIAHVERLRNEDGIEGARIFKIEEVSFEFKPYFRVEIGTAGASMPAPPAPPAPAPAATPAPAKAEQPEEDVEPAMAPVWAPPVETSADMEADRVPAHMATEASDTEITVDPWADAPPPRTAEESTVGNGSGRRGLFGR
jgi:hypothetical protein